MGDVGVSRVTRPVGEEFELEGIRLRVELAPEDDGSLSDDFTLACCVGCVMCDMDAFCIEEPWYSGLGPCDSYRRTDGRSVIFRSF